MSIEVAEILPGRQKKGGRPKGSRTKPNTTLDAQIIAKKLQGLTALETAKTLDITQGEVRRRLDKFAPIFKELQHVGDYRLTRSDLLDASEMAALKNVVEKMDTGTLRECVYAFDKVFTAGRLTRGESTANHSHIHKFTDTQLLDIAKK